MRLLIKNTLGMNISTFFGLFKKKNQNFNHFSLKLYLFKWKCN